MEKYFKVPDDFSAFVYMSQYLQAEAVKIGIEAHRRAKPYCMGTLYWQINDCWPVASWSSIDYCGRWKALQYYARDAYDEVLVSPYASGKQVVFTLVDGHAYWNYVRTGLENADSYTLLEGLKEADVVITSGNINLAHESPVKVIEN